jgi:hypothetical protein
MPPLGPSTGPRICSFCRQEFQVAGAIVVGPDGVGICLGCLRRSMESIRARNAYCSFCCREHKEVRPLVEGPYWVYICPGCIELCAQIVEQERQRTAPPAEDRAP